jgi:hypothetical protein
MDKCQIILREINLIKVQLASLYNISKKLTDNEILMKSKQLDELIFTYQQKCK